MHDIAYVKKASCPVNSGYSGVNICTYLQITLISYYTAKNDFLLKYTQKFNLLLQTIITKLWTNETYVQSFYEEFCELTAGLLQISTYRANKKLIQNFSWKSVRKGQLARSRRRWDNITTGLGEIGWEGEVRINRVQDWEWWRVLWIRQSIFGFHERRGISSLVSSRISSIEAVN
jgi:hypothetical protein